MSTRLWWRSWLASVRNWVYLLRPASEEEWGRGQLGGCVEPMPRAKAA